MLTKERNGVIRFEFEKLQDYPRLGAATFSRHGGVSTGQYESLNMSYAYGDDSACVAENRRRAMSSIDLPHTFVEPQQEHSAKVQRVDDAVATPCCDALVTNKRRLALGIHHADCQATIFFDPVQHAIACVHCGWRGSCQNIYKATIDRMKQEFGSSPEHLICCISASLGPERAEFIHYKEEMPESFWPFQVKDSYFNFWEISRWQLESERVLPQNIEIAGMCSATDHQHFFSYRRDKTRGRNLTCVWLQ